MGCLELANEIARRTRRALGEAEQQLALGAEALRQCARGDPGLRRDPGKRELAWPEPVHRPVGSGKNIFVADFSRARAH